MLIMLQNSQSEATVLQYITCRCITFKISTTSCI